MTSRHAGDTVTGFTQASSVMPLVRCSEAESGTLTREFVPLKRSALPYLPAVVQVAFEIVPVLPLPEESATVVPLPSSKPYADTRPGATVACVVALAGLETGPRLPAPSIARTRYV